MRRLHFFFLIFLLAAFGWGCKKAANPSAQGDGGFQSDAYLPPSPPPETENQMHLRELREAIERFQDARSFRAKLAIETKDGRMTGQIDVTKPERFHGSLQVPSQNGFETSEVIGVEKMFYIRLPNGNWTYVKNQEKSQALTTAFRSAVDGEDSLLGTSIPDSNTVTKNKDSALACDRYTTILTDAEGERTELTICVANGLPKRIEIKPATGGATIDYFDYNKLFVIERPLGVRLD
ncbi:MAG: hypothetical protein WC787_00270 [Patescibacteria group bacterium]